MSLKGGKKSIFARQIAAQRLKEGKAPLNYAPEAAQTREPREQNLPPDTIMDTDECDAAGDHRLQLLTTESGYHMQMSWNVLLHVFFVLFFLYIHSNWLQFQVPVWSLVRVLPAQIAQERPWGSTGRTRPNSKRCLSLT